MHIFVSLDTQNEPRVNAYNKEKLCIQETKICIKVTKSQNSQSYAEPEVKYEI